MGEGERGKGDGGGGEGCPLDPPMVFIQDYIIITCNYCGRSRRHCQYTSTPNGSKFFCCHIHFCPPQWIGAPPPQTGNPGSAPELHHNVVIPKTFRRCEFHGCIYLSNSGLVAQLWRRPLHCFTNVKKKIICNKPFWNVIQKLKQTAEV